MEKEKNIGITSEEMNNKRAGKRLFFLAQIAKTVVIGSHTIFSSYINEIDTFL